MADACVYAQLHLCELQVHARSTHMNEDSHEQRALLFSHEWTVFALTHKSPLA